jgi:dTDP-4-amino-4,6-dideoxygalactose transaminase
LEDIQKRRTYIWNKYYDGLKELDNQNLVKIPNIPSYATNNAHMFYLVCQNIEERSALISKLKENDINAVFHYLSLHKSPFYGDKHDGRELPNCDKYADCLVRLPFYYELKEEEIERVIKTISDFYQK